MTINYSLSDQVSQKGWIENERNQKKRIVGRNHSVGNLCFMDCIDPAYRCTESRPSVLGLVQLIKRRSILRVDPDILLLGIYYVLVIACYLIFEMIPINYRPILINGNLEASYPSSTTLLVLSVMPTLKYQSDRRIANPMTRKSIALFVFAFSLFMVTGRLISGVHWATDIIGSVFLSSGLFMVYRSMAEYTGYRKNM